MSDYESDSAGMRRKQREGCAAVMHVARSNYAIKRFEEEGIRYMRPDPLSDRFFVWSENSTRKYTFYAGTGLISGPYDERGIENMIMIAKTNGGRG